MKKNLISLIILFSVFSCFAQSVAEIQESKPYVASTCWVAAIAELAGIDDVICIAPANLKHPPEYEITPEDIYTVANAQLFMQAGYERMMKTISTAAQVDQEKIIKVKTTNTLVNLENMVNILSEKAGTEEQANIRFSNYKKMIEDARNRIADSPNKDIEIYVNSNQAEFAEDLGLNVADTFGPGQVTSDQIAQAAEKKYVLVIDNYHSTVASPIAEVSRESIILVWKNFPDHTGNDALYNLISENLEMLWATCLF